MNRELVAFHGHEHDDLEEIPGAIWPKDEPPIRIVTEILDRPRVIDRVDDVLGADTVPQRRRMDLHTHESYYESSE